MNNRTIHILVSVCMAGTLSAGLFLPNAGFFSPLRAETAQAAGVFDAVSTLGRESSSTVPLPVKARAARTFSQRIQKFIDARMPHRESAQDRNAARTAPIVRPTTADAAKTNESMSEAVADQNLVANPSFEEVGSHGIPVSWKMGGYGDNTRSLYLIKSAHSGSYAARSYITRYASGDAKWYFTPVAVEGGSTYSFSEWYFSNVQTEVDVQVTHADGSVSYIVLGKPNATVYGDYTQFNSTFTLPQDASMATVFHVIDSAGSLTVDDYSLEEQIEYNDGNYIQNGSLDVSGKGGAPAHWSKGGYGDNVRSFAYPVQGQDGSAARVTIENYQNGDAKWASDLVALPQGQYQYSDSYEADVPSILTAQFERQDGSFFYNDLKTLPASDEWSEAAAYFIMPSDAAAVRVLHLIDQNGSLTIDNASIVDAASQEKGIFKTGAVTFRFDDGLEDQYTVAAPMLDHAAFKGTFYVVSQQIQDNDFAGYMSIAQVQDLNSRGDEIGAHTRTHPHLTTLSSAEQEEEIAGSRQDILGWDAGPVLSFAYPFGEYDSSTIEIVKNAGFQSAAATIDGYITPNSDHYQLEYQEVHNDTTLAQVEQWVDTAAQTHTWLILTFHDVKNDGDLYSVAPDMLQDIVDIVKQKDLPVVTVSEGMQSM